VTAEFCVVELLHGILHVLVTQVLDSTRAVFEDVGEADVACFPHVVLQVLPAAGGWQAADYHTVLGSAGRGSPSTPARDAPCSSETAAAAFWKLHPKPVTVIIVPIPCINCVLGVPGIFKLNKSKWWSSSVLQVNEDNFSILVEKIFNVFAPNIWGQVSHIDAALTSRVPHGWSTTLL